MLEISSFDPMTLVLIAALNPAAIAVAFLMGRAADQWQKVLLAAFASAAAGFALYWLAGMVGLMKVHAIGGEAAIFGLTFVLGLVWASLGYRFRAALGAR